MFALLIFNLFDDLTLAGACRFPIFLLLFLLFGVFSVDHMEVRDATEKRIPG